MQENARVLPLKVLVGVVAFMCAVSAQADDLIPRIAPIDTKPAGQTYGRRKPAHRHDGGVLHPETGGRGVVPDFRPRRHRLLAAKYRREMQQGFRTWQDVTSLPTTA